MGAFLAWLFAAILAGQAAGASSPAPPLNYELTVTGAYADVSIRFNGFELLRARDERRRRHTILLNGFLKPSGNELIVTVTPAFPGQESIGQVHLVRYASGGGPDSIEIVHDGQRLAMPAEARLTFDAPGTPALRFWSAERSPALDDAARAEITTLLNRFQTDVNRALDAKKTSAVVALFQGLPANQDAALYLGPDNARFVAAALVDELAPYVNDQAARGVVRAPVLRPGDLTFTAVGDHVLVARADGGAVAGFLFTTDKGPGGLTVDRPLFGRVDGVWMPLQDLKLAR